MDLLAFVIEMIGTVAFAVSGALVAIEKKMDILGVCVLGATTAVGGGIIRDLIPRRRRLTGQCTSSPPSPSPFWCFCRG